MKTEMNNVANPTREMNFRCKAFAGQGVKLHRVRGAVDENGVASVTVWDSIAGHFTRCHSISPETQQRIVSLLSNIRNKSY